MLNPTTSQVSRCLWTVSTRSYWATCCRELRHLGQGGEASHRFCWESRRFLTWSVGITRDVSHNDKEKFGDRIFGNSPRSGCAHFQNSSSFIISKLFVIFKSQIVFKIQIFSSLSGKQQFHAVCCHIGDKHQMPYTNIHCSVLVYAISAVFLLCRRILDHCHSWSRGGAMCGTSSEPKILRLVRFLDESEAIMSR